MNSEQRAWIERFAGHLSSERRMSPHTVAAYRHDLLMLQGFCDQRRILRWSALDNVHVRAYAAAEHAGGLGPRSIQRRLSAVRTFYEFLHARGLLHAKPRPRCARAEDQEAAADHARCGSNGAPAGVSGS